MAAITLNGTVYQIPDSVARRLTKGLEKADQDTDDPDVQRARFLRGAEEADRRYYEAFEALGHERRLA
jgi:hypothetical protein